MGVHDGMNDNDAKRLKAKYASLVNAQDDKQHVCWWAIQEAVSR